MRVLPLLSLLVLLGSCAGASERGTKLVARQAASKDGIIVFSNSDFEEFAATKGRDYHLMFFLNAHYMVKNADMNLPKLRQEYALAAQVRPPAAVTARSGRRKHAMLPQTRTQPR
eukprot:GHRQ01024972.1.p1 GENE.GHRQ01024972.1~~GHRQ01024972.1.p1  ORF type:complete len:115 (+),score=17.99 GHRQ01024972.1:230-574(+)